jgi:hypothetical protein
LAWDGYIYICMCIYLYIAFSAMVSVRKRRTIAFFGDGICPKTSNNNCHSIVKKTLNILHHHSFNHHGCLVHPVACMVNNCDLQDALDASTHCSLRFHLVSRLAVKTNSRQWNEPSPTLFCGGCATRALQSGWNKRVYFSSRSCMVINWDLRPLVLFVLPLQLAFSPRFSSGQLRPSLETVE